MISFARLVSGEEHAVVTADDLFGRVTREDEEILVHRQDIAFDVKFDNGLRSLYRVDLLLRFHVLPAFISLVGMRYSRLHASSTPAGGTSRCRGCVTAEGNRCALGRAP